MNCTRALLSQYVLIVVTTCGLIGSCCADEELEMLQPSSLQAAPEFDAGRASSFDPKSISWGKLTVDQLITLFERSDLKLETRIAGRSDLDISTDAMFVLDNRIGDNRLANLSVEQRERVIKVLRKHITEGHWENMALVEFASRHDPKFTADALVKAPAAVEWAPDVAFQAFAKGGHPKEAWNLIKSDMNSVDELRVCDAMRRIGKVRFKWASDEVYKRTKALRWLIRLQALRTLDQLDDRRTRETLSKHLGDIERHFPGLRVLWVPSAVAVGPTSRHLRGELIRVLARRKVPGALKTLEKIVMDRGNAPNPVRMAAGEGIIQLERRRVPEITESLLRSNHQGDQVVGVFLARRHGVTRFQKQLEQLANDPAHPFAQAAAKEALSAPRKKQAPSREDERR